MDRNFIKKELRRHKQPLLVLGVVFGVILSALVFGTPILFPKYKLNQTALIQQVTTVHSPVVAGQKDKVQWTTLVKKSDITSKTNLLKLPKDAKKIKVTTLSQQQAKTQVAKLQQNQLAKLTPEARQQLAKTNTTSNNFFAKLTHPMTAALEDAVTNVTETVAETIEEQLTVSSAPVEQTPDATIVDLSAEVPETPAMETLTLEEQASLKEEIKEETIKEELVQVTFETSAPVITEQSTDQGKQVTVSVENELPEQPLTNVLAFSSIPEIYKVGQESKIQIKWHNNNDQEVEFHAYDTDNNGKLDYVEWTVPHLSDQIFEIIFISKAFRLDSNLNITEDIYEQVKTQDNNWVTINNGEYVRATFEQILDNTKDNTIYAKATTPGQTVTIEVYPVYIDAEGNIAEGPKVATFENIDREAQYKVLLTNLQTPTDTFDLKVSGNVEIDWIVDPTTFTAAASGDWSLGTTWGGACASNCTANVDYPGAGDIANVGYVVSISSNQSVGGVTVSGTGSLSFSNNSILTTTSTFSITAGTIVSTGGSDITISANIFSQTAGTIGNAANSGNLNIYSNGALPGAFTLKTITHNGNITIGGTGASQAPSSVTMNGNISPVTTTTYTLNIYTKGNISEASGLGDSSHVFSSASFYVGYGLSTGSISFTSSNSAYIIYSNATYLDAPNGVDLTVASSGIRVAPNNVTLDIGSISTPKSVTIAGMSVANSTTGVVAHVYSKGNISESGGIGASSNVFSKVYLYAGYGLSTGSVSFSTTSSTYIIYSNATYLDAPGTVDFAVSGSGIRVAPNNATLDIGSVSAPKSVTVGTMSPATSTTGVVAHVYSLGNISQSGGFGASAVNFFSKVYLYAGYGLNSGSVSFSSSNSTYTIYSSATYLDAPGTVDFAISGSGIRVGPNNATLDIGSISTPKSVTVGVAAPAAATTGVVAHVYSFGGIIQSGAFAAAGNFFSKVYLYAGYGLMSGSVSFNTNSSYTIYSSATYLDAPSSVDLTVAGSGIRVGPNNATLDIGSVSAPQSVTLGTVTPTTNTTGVVLRVYSYGNITQSGSFSASAYPFTSINFYPGYGNISPVSYTKSSGSIYATNTYIDSSAPLTINGMIIGFTSENLYIGSATKPSSIITENNITVPGGALSFATTGTFTQNNGNITSGGSITISSEGTSYLKTMSSAGGLTLNKDSAYSSYSLNESVSVTGTITVDSGVTAYNNSTVTAGSLTGSGTWEQMDSSTLNYKGSTIGISNFDANTYANTVVYNGTGSQTVLATSYQNLTLNNSSASFATTSGSNIAGTLTLSAGDITQNANLSVGNYSQTGGIFSSSGILTVYGNWEHTAGTFTPGSNTVIFYGATPAISGSTTFNNLTLSAPQTVTFTAGTTQTIGGTFSCTGTAGNIITITSSNPGTPAILSKTTSTVNCDYLSLANSTAAGGASWNAGVNSTIGTNVTGWRTDYVLPILSNISPASGLRLNNFAPKITFTLSKESSCRASIDATHTTYESMSGDFDCTGDGTASASCQMSDLTGMTNNVYIICQDAVGNSSEISHLVYTQPYVGTEGGGVAWYPIVEQIKQVPGKIIDGVGSIVEQIKDIVSPQPAPIINYPPIAESVPKETPSALKNLEVMSINPLSSLSLSPVRSDVAFFAEKISSFKDILSKLNINASNLSETEKLEGADLYLPGLTQIVMPNVESGNLALVPSTPVAQLNDAAIAKIPSGIIFAKTAEQLIDLKTSIKVGENGQVQQGIAVIANQPLNLVFKPEKPASRVTGLLTLTKLAKAEKKRYLNLFEIMGASVSSEFELPVEKNTQNDLLLQKFEYSQVKPGVFVANISAPADEGDYKISTVVEYEDRNLPITQTQITAKVDSEGYVYSSTTAGRVRIENATISIFWLNPENKKYELWPAEKFMQKNPVVTNNTGRYSFLVPQGSYYLEVSAKNYKDYKGQPFEIKESNAVRVDIQLNKKGLLSWQTVVITLLLVLIFIMGAAFAYRKRIIKT